MSFPVRENRDAFIVISLVCARARARGDEHYAIEMRRHCVLIELQNYVVCAAMCTLLGESARIVLCACVCVHA